MASRVLSVKLSEDVIAVLGARAVEMGITRNKLAALALEAVLDDEAVAAEQRRRVNAEIRARLERECELIESGAIHYSCLGSVNAGSPSEPRTDETLYTPVLPPAATNALTLTDIRIARLTRIIESTDIDAIRLQAIDARSAARDRRMRIVLGTDAPGVEDESGGI